MDNKELHKIKNIATLYTILKECIENLEKIIRELQIDLRSLKRALDDYILDKLREGKDV